MDYTTFPVPSDAGKNLEPCVMTSLYEAFQQLADVRRSQGKRYTLALILCLLVLAKMAGQTSLSGATEWIRHRAALLAEQFGLRRMSMPCQMTYCNVLARVDAKRLDEILQAFFVRWEAKPRSGAEPSRLRTPHPGTGGSCPSGDRWQTVLSLMDRVGVRNVARQMRYFDAHPEQALALVLSGSYFVS